MNPYYTHQQYLKQELDNLSIYTDKQINILELGVGEGSSSLMYEFCKEFANANVLAFENNREWSSSMKDKYSLPNYSINYILDWNDTYYQNIITNNDNRYDLVFIDQNPWEARIEAIDKLYNRFCIAILHDYDYYNSSNCRYCYDEKSFFVKYLSNYSLIGYNQLLPPTLVFKHVDY